MKNSFLWGFLCGGGVMGILAFMLGSAFSKTPPPSASVTPPAVKSAGARSSSVETANVQPVQLRRVGPEPSVRVDPEISVSEVTAALPTLSVGGVNISAILEADPEYVRLQRLSARRRIERDWNVILAVQGISKPVADRVIETLVDREMLPLKYRALAAQNSGSSDALESDFRRESSDIGKSLSDQLGAGTFESMQGLAKKVESVSRMIDRELVPDLQRQGVPCTEEQAKALTATFLKNFEEGRGAPRARILEWDQLLVNDAGRYLTPAQLDVLRTTVEQKRQLQNLMNQAYLAAKKKSGQSEAMR